MIMSPFKKLAGLVTLVVTSCLLAQGQQPQKQYTGAELIAAVKAARPKGDLQIRATLNQKGQPAMQIQIKRHTSANGDELHLYQILFPKNRKGEGLSLRVSSRGFSGWVFKPGSPPVALKPSDRNTGLFGTDLLIEDLLADFLEWPQHQVVGKEKLGAADCSIVESHSAGATSGAVKKVRSWMEDERLYPKKIILMDAGDKVLREVITEKVTRSSSGYYVPSEFAVINATSGSRTTVSGKGLRDDLKFTDDDFTDTALSKGVGSSAD